MNKRARICIAVALVTLLLIVFRHLFQQRISSVAEFRSYMGQFGFSAPLFLTAFQALQVVFPVLPGFTGCIAGALTFGTLRGFLCNYIGISIGSIIAFFLGKRYGEPLVRSLFSEKTYRTWSLRCREQKLYDAFLFVATLLPLFPDDFLCYFSGMIKMNTKRFIMIIILGKPWCILAYSILFGMVK